MKVHIFNYILVKKLTHTEIKHIIGFIDKGSEVDHNHLLLTSFIVKFGRW